MPAFKLSPKAGAELARAILDYDTAREALGEMLEDIATDWESALEDKSEKWRASDAGQEAQEATDNMRAASDAMPEMFDGDLGDLPPATPQPDRAAAVMALLADARSARASVASARRSLKACRDLGLTVTETRRVLTWLNYYDGEDKPVAAVAAALLGGNG